MPSLYKIKEKLNNKRVFVFTSDFFKESYFHKMLIRNLNTLGQFYSNNKKAGLHLFGGFIRMR